MKTARFSTIVARCGRPLVHLSWVAPEKDRALMTAVRAQRVMTVHQQLRGSAKDYGTVGLMKGGASQLLVFPQTLRKFSDQRIVAIDYSLLAPVGSSSSGSQTQPLKAKKIASRTSASALRLEKAARASAAAGDAEPVHEEKPPQQPALTFAFVRKEIDASRRELKAEKTGAAYKRLGALAGRLRKGESSPVKGNPA